MANHYEETKTVLTKKEFDEAVKDQYGKICITGDLLEDIKKKYDIKNEKFAAGLVGFWVFGVMQLIPVIGTLCSVLTLVCGGLYLGNRKSAKYSIRPELSTNPNELWLLHIKEVEKIRNQYIGIDNGTATNMSQLDDMISMNVNTIQIKADVVDDILNAIRDSKIFKKDREVDIHSIEKYKNYRIIKDNDNYRFTRIR